MSDFERKLIILLNDTYIGMDDLKDFICNSINDKSDMDINRKEFIRLLPIIIKNTNEMNFSWISDIKKYASIPGFLEQFIEYLFLINFEEYQSLFLCLMADFRVLPIKKEHLRLFFHKILDYRVNISYDAIYYMTKNIFPDMVPEMLLFFIKDSFSCNDVIPLFKKDNGVYMHLLYENIDTILEHINEDKMFYLKDIVKDNDKVYKQVVSTIKLNSKKNIMKLLKSMYMRVVITHSYYHDLSYIQEDCFKNVLEIIYLIIDDVCKNENVDISNIHNIGCGSYSSVLLIGNKVVKFGLSRVTPHFPNNPYVNTMLLRKEFSINDKQSMFVEVNERVDTNSDISDEELFQLYKKLRNIHLIWIDVAKRNVGRLLRDKHVYWRFDLPLTDKILGLGDYRGNEMLKKGDVVILDNDLIYDEEEFDKYKLSSTQLQKDFEKRYQKEKNFPQESGKLILKK